VAARVRQVTRCHGEPEADAGKREPAVLGKLGVDSQGLLGRALADLRPNHAILDLVRRIRDQGIRAAVMSNSWGTGDYDPYEGYDLEERFDAVIISDQVALRKPDPAIYALTAAKIDAPPRSCVFVDDTAANLPPARDLGMAVVHFTDTASGIAEIERLLNTAGPARVPADRL
jgi:putative hydrolase of the HAD superfamily